MVFYDFLFHAVSYESDLPFTKLVIPFQILPLYLGSIFDYDFHVLYGLMGGKNCFEMAQPIDEVFFKKRHKGVMLQVFII
jgi:hypothetical protein